MNIQHRIIKNGHGLYRVQRKVDGSEMWRDCTYPSRGPWGTLHVVKELDTLKGAEEFKEWLDKQTSWEVVK